MKRRDFIKLTAAGVAGLALPAALTAPALGTGWRDFYVTTWFKKPPSRSELLDYHFDCFRRRMDDAGLTEIREYSYEIMSPPVEPRGSAWVVEAHAKLR